MRYTSDRAKGTVPLASAGGKTRNVEKRAHQNMKMKKGELITRGKKYGVIRFPGGMEPVC